MTTEVKAKTFFCHACLEDHVKEQSADERYCQRCSDMLLKESKHYSGNPSWAPRAGHAHRRFKDKSIDAAISRLQNQANGGKKQGRADSTDRHQIKRPSVTKAVTPLNEGETPIPENVTDDKIFELHKKGMTTRAIGKIVGVSHMTVARKLAGQRNLL